MSSISLYGVMSTLHLECVGEYIALGNRSAPKSTTRARTESAHAGLCVTFVRYASFSVEFPASAQPVLQKSVLEDRRPCPPLMSESSIGNIDYVSNVSYRSVLKYFYKSRSNALLSQIT